MRRSIVQGPLFFILLMLALAPRTPSAAPGEDGVLDIGSRLELFVDRFLIDSMDGVRLKLHEPRPAGVALALDRPWEGIVSAYGTVIKDGDGYKLYYRGRPLYL